MLKKAVTSNIVQASRKCSKCGATVSINPVENKTYCKCGECVYENTEIASVDSKAE